MVEQGASGVSNPVTSWLQDLQATLAQFVSTEERIGISVALVALAFGVAIFLAPRVVSRASVMFHKRVLQHSKVPDSVTDVAWIFPATVIVRALQLGVFVLVSLSLLLL
ncbi:mechanosensitive ion channel family protein, partial [Halorubrum sp. Atlit-28R]